MDNEIQILKDAYSALNRNDVAGFVKDFDPQIVRVEFEGSPTGGAFHGIDDVTAHVQSGRSTWAEGSCEPERFIVVGDNIVVPVYVRVRLKDRTDWIEGRPADVYAFRDGKIVQFRSFFNESEALEWAEAT